MTNSNIIIRSCIALLIVLSIMLAGGAPSGPTGARIGTTSVSQCHVELGLSDYELGVC